MKKLIKWILGIISVLALLLLLAIFILPMVFDPNDHKPQIQRVIAENIGREVQLNGPIEWSVFPWLAININQLSVANEPGFKGDHLAQIEQVAVRVKLLPLLSKQIKVGNVELVKPQIQLQIAKSGKTNWQSILDQLESGPATNQTDESTTDLEVRGILVSDGILNYKDTQSDLELMMTDMSFQSEAIKANSSTPMNLKANLKMPEYLLDGNLDLGWSISQITGDKAPVINFNQISFSGLADGMNLELSSGGTAVFDLGKDSLIIDTMELNYGEVKLTTPIQGQHMTSNMALSGQLSIEQFSLAEQLNKMGTPLDNEASNLLSGFTQWSLHNDRLQMKEVNFKLDESEVKGDIDLRALSQLRGSFNLSVNSMNIDRYLPNDDSHADHASSSSESELDLGHLDGQIKMGKLQAAGVKLNDITLKIKTQGADITVEPLQAGFYQGLIKTELKLQPKKPTQKLQLTHQMQDFQAGSLLTDLMGTDFLTGLGQLNADIKIDEPFSDRPFKTANGSISYQLTDGDIVGIDVFQIMQQSLSLLNKSDAVKANSDLKTAFGLMEINADVNNGVLKTNTMKLNSPYFNLTGQVEVDLDQQTINGTIKPMLTNIPEGVLDERFEKLLNIKIPVSIKGNLLEPDISIDVAKLILESQKSKIDEKKEALKEDLFDALLGSNKDKKKQGANQDGNDAEPEMTEKEKKKAEKDQLKRDLLEGLFKSKKDEPKDSDEDKDTGGNQ